MKKVIGIYFPDWTGYFWDGTYAKNNALGGSERWVVDTASEFQRRGFKVIVFGCIDVNHFDYDGVEYIKCNDFIKRCEYQHFDYFIYCRSVREFYDGLDCSNIYIHADDAYIDGADSVSELKLDRIKKIVCLSEWHKKIFKDYIYKGLKDEDIILIPNPNINTLYKDVDINNKENTMLWSSRPERGLKWFIDNVFYEIRKEVPDFKLKICSYTDKIFDKDIDGIEYIGRLSREELAEEQKKCKLWAYPNFGIDGNGYLFHETFCNTAVENALAGNAIVCWEIGGLATTLKGMYNFLDSSSINIYDGCPKIDKEGRSKSFTDECIKILTDEQYRKILARKNIEIGNRYTPKKCCDVWINEFGLNYMI